MKIAATNPDGGAFKYIMDGLGNAFRSSGSEFATAGRPAARGVKIGADWDLYLGCSGWRQIIPPKRARKGLVGLHINPWGPSQVGSIDGGPKIDETAEAIQWTLAQEPDFVWCYCSDTFTDDYFGNWKANGIPVVGCPTAADIVVYQPTPKVAKYNCDIGWVGGKWGYKAKMLDRYMSPLIKKYPSTQVYGWGGWPRNMKIADGEVSKLFASAKICPSVSESHSVSHPVDIPERVFKVPACGGFTIHTPSVAIEDLFGDAIPMAKNPAHWMQLIDHYLTHDRERVEAAEWQRSVVLRRHTYHDRAASMMRQVNRQDVVEALMKAKQTLS